MNVAHYAKSVPDTLILPYDKTGQYNRSVPLYQRAISQDPTNAEILCDIGFRSSINGDFKSAMKYFELALIYAPNLERAHNNMAVVLARKNRPDMALNHFLQAGCTREQAQHNLAQLVNVEPSQPPQAQTVALVKRANWLRKIVR